MKEDTKHFIKLWFVIILLIIIILLLAFHNNIGTIEHDLIPTGHIDIFDIDINCGCDTCNTDDTNIPTFNEDTDKDIIGKVFVNDKEGNYLYQQKLNIFENAFYEYTNKIAPGVSNTYSFVVHNSSNINIKYKIAMQEKAKYKVNMKYRLKKNNEYIIGDDNTWVSSDELITGFNHLNSYKSDSYSLDWKWFDAPNDTMIGKDINSEYHLGIKIYIEQD